MSSFRSFTSAVIAAALIPLLAAPLTSYAYELDPKDSGTESGHAQELENFDSEAQRLSRIIHEVNAELTAATLVFTTLAEEFFNPETGVFDVPTERLRDWDEASEKVDRLLRELNYLETELRQTLVLHEEFPELRSDLPRTRDNPSGIDEDKPKKAEP